MLDRDAIKGKMASYLNQPLARLEDGRALTDLVAESFVLVEMVIELQEAFGVRLVHDDVKSVKTVGDLTQVLAERAGR